MGKGRYILGGVALTYLLACVPNSVKVSRELKTLADEFTKTAKNSQAIEYTTTFEDSKLETARRLDYGGRLDSIVKKRNNYLKQNKSFLFDKWKASSDADGKYASAQTSAFCYNPIARIKPYQRGTK